MSRRRMAAKMSAPSASDGRHAGHERRVLEVRAVEAEELLQVRPAEGGAAHLLVRPLRPHLPDQQGAQRARHLPGALVAHDEAEEALPQALLDGVQQGLPFPLPDLLVGVPRDAEEVAAHDRHFREELVDVGPDDRLQPDQVGRRVRPVLDLHGRRVRRRRHRDEAGQVARHLDPGVAQPGVGIVQDDGEVDAAVGDVRELVRRVDRQRGEHGVDVALEVAPGWPRAARSSSSSTVSRWIPAPSSSSFRPSQRASCSATIGRSRSATASSSSEAVRPSGRSPAVPACTPSRSSRSPETSSSKNSSMRWWVIPSSQTRCSRGCRRSCTSSRQRRTNSSRLSWALV